MKRKFENSSCFKQETEKPYESILRRIFLFLSATSLCNVVSCSKKTNRIVTSFILPNIKICNRTPHEIDSIHTLYAVTSSYYSLVQKIDLYKILLEKCSNCTCTSNSFLIRAVATCSPVEAARFVFRLWNTKLSNSFMKTEWFVRWSLQDLTCGTLSPFSFQQKIEFFGTLQKNMTTEELAKTIYAVFGPIDEIKDSNIEFPTWGVWNSYIETFVLYHAKFLVSLLNELFTYSNFTLKDKEVFLDTFTKDWNAIEKIRFFCHLSLKWNSTDKMNAVQTLIEHVAKDPEELAECLFAICVTFDTEEFLSFFKKCINSYDLHTAEFIKYSFSLLWRENAVPFGDFYSEESYQDSMNDEIADKLISLVTTTLSFYCCSKEPEKNQNEDRTSENFLVEQ